LELRAPEELEKAPRADAGWEGVDRGLFEALRELRRAFADERAVPPFVIFGDMTLRELARVRPVTPEAFLSVKGVGERKQADFGERFVSLIATYCKENQATSASAPRRTSAASDAVRTEAFRLFEQGKSLEEAPRPEHPGRCRAISRRTLTSIGPRVSRRGYRRLTTRESSRRECSPRTAC
jgi:ATP-dependent DNA helicase RecQ